MSKDFKAYALIWIVTHLFLFGFMSIIYLALGQPKEFFEEMQICALILFAVEFLMIGFVVALEKIIKVYE